MTRTPPRWPARECFHDNTESIEIRAGIGEHGDAQGGPGQLLRATTRCLDCHHCTSTSEGRT